MLGSIPLNISFRRALVGDNMVLWVQLVSLVMNTKLTHGGLDVPNVPSSVVRFHFVDFG